VSHGRDVFIMEEVGAGSIATNRSVQCKCKEYVFIKKVCYNIDTWLYLPKYLCI